MNQIIQTLLTNKHTSGAAGVYALVAVLGHIANIWFPAHTPQVDSTIQVVKEACIGWGMLMAGDASAGKKDNEQLKSEVKTAIETGNTDVLTKTEPKV